MELQLALDRIEKKRAIDIVESLKDLIDIVEIGTPFSIMQPIEIINDFKKISPCLRVLADYKIMDGGYALAEIAYKAGADIVTVSAQTWDETIALKAKVGEYAIVAKRKGDKWYIGGMTNNREQQRDFELNLNFLKEGQTYRMTSFEDGINANRQAMDYRMKERTLRKGDKLTISLARNGGFAAVIE